MSGTVRAVVAEDEPEARRNLRDYSAGIEWLAVVGEASDGPEAVRLVDRLRPDLLFLDVALPGLSGLEVIGEIRHRPAVVFTTAHDQYALAAFEAGALDYLLKPFGRRRFEKALERVRTRLPDRPSVPERARAAFDAPLRRLFARHRDGIVPIPVETIIRIRARGDYVEVVSPAGNHLLHMTLTELATRLDPDRFCRIHRSELVNLDAIDRLVPSADRRLLVRCKDGSEILASRSGSETLKRFVR